MRLKESAAAVMFGGSLVLFCMAEYALVTRGVFRPLELSAAVSLLVLSIACAVRLLESQTVRDSRRRFIAKHQNDH